MLPDLTRFFQSQSGLLVRPPPSKVRIMNPRVSLLRFVITFLFVLTSLFYLIRSKVAESSPGYDSLYIRMCHNALPELGHKLDRSQPVLYIVTPTFARREQVAELTRLAQTLLHVSNMIWFVIEDATECLPMVSEHLARHQIPYVHMVAPLPEVFLGKGKKPRGVSQRNAAIQWILTHPDLPEGVLYFADDDNTYDLRLFEDIRKTKKVSMFPVGLLANTGVSSPIVMNGRVVGFSDPWFAKRKFPLDMSGFAVNIRLLTYNPSKVPMPFIPGYQEDKFLQGLVSNWEDIEPLAENCTKVWVWHTTTVETPAGSFRPDKPGTNLPGLFEELQSTGVIQTSKTAPVLPVCQADEICE